MLERVSEGVDGLDELVGTYLSHHGEKWTQNWKNIFANYISEKTLIPKIPKIPQQLETESYNQDMGQKSE